jgi:hypothetical protein
LPRRIRAHLTYANVMSTVRTNARGRWRFNYQFGGTSGRITYRFRVVIPHEGDYPFDTGRSRVVRVTVRGP